MIRRIKQYLAIRRYVRRLSHELVRRFGKKQFYSIEQVTQAVRRGNFSATFIAYAHAAFCSEPDFGAHYHSIGSSCSYRELRHTIGRRYLYGALDFDAQPFSAGFGLNTIRASSMRVAWVKIIQITEVDSRPNERSGVDAGRAPYLHMLRRWPGATHRERSAA